MASGSHIGEFAAFLFHTSQKTGFKTVDMTFDDVTV